LKVDRAFIKNINANSENGELAKLIIAMAKSLGLSVVAEGVETQDQLNFLKQNACDEFQGYFVSPPVPANDFTDLLKKQHLESSAVFESF
jgi:EAL domain-containing protein (putative c-di-GMP-specific phosphodiesterase class I)